MPWPIITLDGPAGVGKSTLARRIGDALRIPCLDTGAMFRSLALRLAPYLEAHSASHQNAPHQALSETELRERCAVSFSMKGNGTGTVLYCDNIPVGDEIRTETVALLASRVARLRVVRDILKQAQRALGASTSLVAEGRDMGTVVFPEARHKFFLIAAPEIRAKRRFLELQARGEQPDIVALTAQICRRDALDSNRDIAPLKQAVDAEAIDTSSLDIEGVIRLVLARIAARGGM